MTKFSIMRNTPKLIKSRLNSLLTYIPLIPPRKNTRPSKRLKMPAGFFFSNLTFFLNHYIIIYLNKSECEPTLIRDKTNTSLNFSYINKKSGSI